VPTSFIDRKGIQDSVKDLGRRLKIKFFFRSVQKAYAKNDKTFVNKSKWTRPEKSVDPKLLSCIKAFTEEVNELNLLPEKRNLTPSELIALRQLRNNRNIVFKKADKGPSTGIMDKVRYLTEGYRQLNNSVHYKKLNNQIILKKHKH